MGGGGSGGNTGWYPPERYLVQDNAPLSTSRELGIICKGKQELVDNYWQWVGTGLIMLVRQGKPGGFANLIIITVRDDEVFEL